MGEEKQYMLLDAIGNPIAKKEDNAPYIFTTLREAYAYAEEEIKKQDAVSVVEIKVIERFGSGM